MNKIFHDQFEVGSLRCNCHLLVCPETKRAAIVDPGDEPDLILRKIKEAEEKLKAPIQLEWILQTHGHFDHIGASRELKEAFPTAKIALHSGDEPLYQQLPLQGKMYGQIYKPTLPLDHRLQDLEEFSVGKIKFQILHAPGHSPGSIGIRLNEDSALGISETLFSGDTLFQESVGRTDLWGGDEELLRKSIQRRFFTLDDDTLVCPGHGDSTKIGIEKRTNPYV